MSKRTLLWLLPLAAYLIFTIWYTDLSGPLSDTEIASFEARFLAGGATPQQATRLRQFLKADTGRQFLMLNVIEMRKDPAVISGAPIPADSAAYLAHYMEHMYPALLSRAGHPAFAGQAVHGVMDLAGIEGAETWSTGALMRYRSRRDLAEIVTDPVFNERHDFKLAAMEKTIAFPVEPVLYLSDARLLLALLLLAITALADIAIYGRQGGSRA